MLFFLLNTKVLILFLPTFVHAMKIKEISALVKKDFTLELRQKYSFFSVLLYVISTTYISYLVFKQISDYRSWNALFWIILIFASISTATRSFQNEGGGRYHYYFQLFDPRSIILSKIIYNGLITTFIVLFTYLFFSLLLGNPVKNQGLFLITLILGSTGFSSLLTMVAGIASKANNNATLMAVLSIPLLLPLVITLVEISTQAIFGLSILENISLIGVIVLLNFLIVTLSFLLFPYIWRD